MFKAKFFKIISLLVIMSSAYAIEKSSPTPNISTLKLAAAAAEASYVSANTSNLEYDAINYVTKKGYEYIIVNGDSNNDLTASKKNNTLKTVSNYDYASHREKYENFKAVWDINDLGEIEDKNSESNGITGYQVLLAKNHNTNEAIISFRGSSNINNWIVDAAVIPSYFLPAIKEKVTAHTGFQYYLVEVINNQEFKEWYKNNINKDTKILISGHSLGGAVAILFNAYLISEKGLNPDNISMVTYAAPAPGQYNFAEYYKDKIKNFVWVANVIDPVGYITQPFDYYHFSIPYFIITVKESWMSHSMDNYYSYIMELDS
ncbi:lipase family protein [Francisella sciaenopsi]|uniref:Fungal lipase-type domain-containing protein n=1 Tax=Francisella sciaenopsi TaxID=3055034 RepID=A0ABQ6PFQ9_9GAMM